MMRVPPAGLTQREFRKGHGDHLAANLDLNKLGFMIMNWRDGWYWVVDGQHRLYALLQWGFAPDDVVDCEVYENLTDAEMADMFLGRSDVRLISAFDKFLVAVTAGRKRETDILRAVETQGCKISRRATDLNSVSAVSALGKVYDRNNDVVLGQVIRTLRDGFGGDASAYDAQLIEATGLIFNRYNGKTNERDLAARLAETPHGVHGLLRRAESQRERTGNQKAQCLAAVIVEIYNKGVQRAKRLPSWWKEHVVAEEEG
jgi:hypothetical protein